MSIVPGRLCLEEGGEGGLLSIVPGFGGRGGSFEYCARQTLFRRGGGGGSFEYCARADFV